MAACGDVQVQARPFQARSLLDAAFARLRSDLAMGGYEAASGTLRVVPAARPAVNVSTESLA